MAQVTHHGQRQLPSNGPSQQTPRQDDTEPSSEPSEGRRGLAKQPGEV